MAEGDKPPPYAAIVVGLRPASTIIGIFCYEIEQADLFPAIFLL